jgi:hypothetical protein
MTFDMTLVLSCRTEFFGLRATVLAADEPVSATGDTPGAAMRQRNGKLTGAVRRMARHPFGWGMPGGRGGLAGGSRERAEDR